MKKLTLFLFFAFLALAARSTTWTVTNSGFSFSPMTITIHQGDTVVFDLDNIHTVIEVSQTTWNNNDNTPLNGGFQLGNGGGTVLPADLEVGTHWYVCGPHASGGMKGIIIVETSTAIDEPATGTGLSILPNPSTGKFQVYWSNTNVGKEYKIEIVDMDGRVVYSTVGNGEQKLTQNLEINLADYPAGFYFVRLHDNLGIHAEKLILQK